MIKELNIFGDIVSVIENKSEVSPFSVKNEIDGLTNLDELIVNIDCYGGEVYAAIAIRSIIKNSPAKKTFNVLGICASAATMLFDELDEVNISNGAMMMYHKPLIGVHGNSIDLRLEADKLDRIENENILKNLAVRTKKPIDELSKLVAGEWWLTSDEAINDLGFIGSKTLAIENTAKTKQENIYKNYIEKKKALNVNAFIKFTNFKNQLKK